jgi:two-component system, OmpR family, phosphate regulon sensor histidine kinase PhoR
VGISIPALADKAGLWPYASAMDQSEKRLLDLLHTPAMLLKGGQIDFANAAARDLLGGHIVGQDPRIAIRDPKAVSVLASESGGSVRIESIAVPGSAWNLACHPLDGDTRLLTLEDLSVRISVAKAHADFVANASHELRTPLAAVLGYVETLENPKAGGDEKTRARFLGTIKHEARRMQALVEDLMSLSRIEAGKHDAPAEPVDLVGVVRRCVEDARGLGDVSFGCDADSITLTGDRGQLEQAVRNLIENAFKYGRPGGPVQVNLEVSEMGRILLFVKDEGPGIAPEHLPRLTERFYRADAGRSRAAGGTGLGLSIVKHIVERHRGRFDLISRVGEGTTATIIFQSAARHMS